MMFTKFSKKTLEAVRRRYAGKPFMSIDPGHYGCAVPWTGSEQRTPGTPILLRSGVAADEIGEAAAAAGISLFVVEQPYVGKNVQSALRAAESQGIVYGRLQSYVPVVHVVRVAPSSWQTVIPCPEGMKRTRQWVEEQMQERWKGTAWYESHAANMEDLAREGLRASATIGAWWREVC